MWQVSHIIAKLQRTEEKLITLFIGQMHRDTITFKLNNTTLILHHLVFVHMTLLHRSD